MPMKWDDGAVAMLCGTIVAILGTEGITQEQKDAIVERMNSAGYDVAWNGVRFEDIKGDLFEAIWRVTAPTFGPEQQAAVIAQLKAKGIDMTWDAVRYESHLPLKLKFANWSAPGLHEDLITVLLKQDIVSTENWKAVLVGMHEAQYQFTWRGFEQHLQKLKKKDPNGLGAAAPSTPKGKKTAASAAGSGAKLTSKRGRTSAKTVLDMEEEADDEFNGSPTKKTKTEKQAETESKVDQVKAEHVEEDDTI
ncbi:hypothetical protein PspLS_00833 [Pyricularia sp. CBS 133598]|nr:hypothetical protein PspLS_00833 [Pyricularia sp. CBS 133598]